MWTNTPEAHKLVEEITRKIVDEVASEEIPLFDELIQEYFDKTYEQRLSARSKEEPLSSGLGEMLPAVTPAAAAMVSIVLTHLANEILKLPGTVSSEMVKEKIKNLISSKENTKNSFTAEQFSEIKNMARKQAKAFGMEPTTANQMADALIGSLATLSSARKQ